MKLVLTVVYLLVGVWYVVRVRAWRAADTAVRLGAGLGDKCPDCHPTPPVAKWTAIVLGCAGDVAVWPVNVIATLWRRSS